MKVEQLFTSCLAEMAYYIESNGEAAIIDPLRETEPYLEMATVNDIKTARFNSSGVGFIYSVGLEIEIIPNRFEIFLNLAQSSDVTDYQENSYSGINSFTYRITFVFDLNNLTPSKLKKQLKLF